MRCVLIKGPSLYEGTRTFIDEAARAFERLGFVADIVDLQGVESWPTLLAAAGRGPAHLVFSINIAGEARHPERGWISEIFEAPHLVWHVDFILGQNARLEGTLPTTAMLVIDPTQADGVRKIYGANRFPLLSFCPHAAVGEPAPDDADAAEFTGRRPIPILWSGSFQEPGAPPWAGADKTVRKVFDDAFDLAIGVEWMPPLDAMDKVLRSRGADPADPDMKSLRLSCAAIDTQVRMTRRFAFVEALAATGLPVHICGVGWEPHLSRFANATYEGVVPMTRMSELMRQSRVVVSTNGNFGAGSHERPLSALLAGAAAFSDYSRFYGEAFAEDQEITLFRWRTLASGVERLKDLANNPAAALDQAWAGKQKVLAGHTFDSRALLLLEVAEQARLLTQAASR